MQGAWVGQGAEAHVQMHMRASKNHKRSTTQMLCHTLAPPTLNNYLDTCTYGVYVYGYEYV